MKKHQILIELIELRDKDYTLFMEKFYMAVTNEFSDVLKKELLTDNEHREALKSMIQYFERLEDYEKCDVLLHLLNNYHK